MYDEGTDLALICEVTSGKFLTIILYTVYENRLTLIVLPAGSRYSVHQRALSEVKSKIDNLILEQEAPISSWDGIETAK